MTEAFDLSYARELVDRLRVLTDVMLEKPDNAVPNYILLLILSDQLKMLDKVFDNEEIRELNG